MGRCENYNPPVLYRTLSSRWDSIFDNFVLIYLFIMKDNNVPYEDIIGADETGIQVIPASKRTLAPRGSRQVPGTAKKSLAQITKMTAITYMGKMLPYMGIFTGKTAAVLPSEVEPSPGSRYTCTPTHYANAATTLEWVKEILVPFILAQRQSRIDNGTSTEEVENSRWAVLIWDNFSAHADAQVQALLESYRIKSFFLPANCTSKYQALDVLINGYEKELLKKHFSEWHFQQLQQALAKNPDSFDVLPKTAAKKRALIATLIRGVHEILEQKTELILKAWDMTKLFDEDRHTAPHKEPELNDVVVQAMNDLTLEQGNEMVEDDLVEDEPTPEQDAPDAEHHANIFDLTEAEESFELVSSVSIRKQHDNPDLETFEPPRKRISPQDQDAQNSDHASSSAESFHAVHIERPKHGGSLKVTYGSKFQAPAQRVVQVLKDKHVIPTTATLHSTSNETPTGYNMVLSGAQHGAVALNAPTLAWKQGTSTISN